MVYSMKGEFDKEPVYSEYSDIRIYSNILFRIYSYSKIFVSFLPAEYIRIFVRATFCLMNIFGYSFVEVSHNKYLKMGGVRIWRPKAAELAHPPPQDVFGTFP